MTEFPFTAIVGMEQAKKSLLYHAIDPRIGGTLLLGHRGCAKSTLVRAFAEILQAVSGQPAPFVEVPLGTTEDRLLGSVNAEALVEQNKWQGRAGLIEEANGGVLYIDEVNLLPDHLADFILDSAASGRYGMERDGLTRKVESRYILVGTMNPEEGDLRPQLSDRFAHGVRIRDDFPPEKRMEIVRRRLAFDDDPEAFAARHTTDAAVLIKRIAKARERLGEVQVPDDLRMAVAAKGSVLGLEGIRAELAVVRTARCAAAWDGRREVNERDLEEAWELCLGHRIPPSPVPPRPPANSNHDATRPSQTATTPPEPRDARSDSVAISPPASESAEELRAWWLGRQEPVRGRAVCGALSEARGGSIAWLDSLVASARAGWLDRRAAFRLLHRLPPARTNLWCFLDASRSTGASRFLGAARHAINSLPGPASGARFHLLALRDGEPKWLARNSTVQGFKATLARLDSAAGKSLIVESLRLLHRAKLRKGGSAFDRVLIASDGLATPTDGRNPVQQLRQSLLRLVRLRSPVAWIHPPAKRGLGRLLAAVCEGTGVVRVEIQTLRRQAPSLL